MALQDLTSREAVVWALNEYDRLGSAEFLRQHHFGPARSYLLKWNGRHFDSKAIAGVAHNHERPDLEALTTENFTGGEATVVKKLKSLGFTVDRVDESKARSKSQSSGGHLPWRMRPGEEGTRTSIQDEYLGSRSSVSSAPALGSDRNDVILWWRAERGSAYGYEDGWTTDGSAFYFSGMGQQGDQHFGAPYTENGRVHDHVLNGDRIRLLRYTGKNAVLYVGELRLDPADPWLWRDGYDRLGDRRKVIQFRFLPVGPNVRDPDDPAHPSSTESPTHESLKAVPAAPSPTNVEALKSKTFRRLIRAQQALAERTELQLVHAFRDWLKHEHDLGATGLRIPYRAEGRDLRADLFLPGPRVLIEAKSSPAQEKIRLTIGQLLDYSRWIEPVPALCVLLPTAPPDDMLDLLRTLNIGAAWPEDKGFHLDPADLCAMDTR